MASMWTNAAPTVNYNLEFKYKIAYTLDEANECYNITATPYMWVNSSGSGTTQHGYGTLTGKQYFLHSNNATIKFTDGNNTSNVSYVLATGLKTEQYAEYKTNYALVQNGSATKPPYKFTVPYDSNNGACSFKISYRDGTKVSASAQDWTEYVTNNGTTYYTYIANNTATKRTDVVVTLPTVEVATGPKVWNGTEWKKTDCYVYNGSAWNKAVPYIYNGTEWKTLK